jgi:ferritin
VANAQIMSSYVVGQGLPEQLAQDWLRELEQLGQDGEYFFSLSRYLFTATRK